jgi:hypothetical protein
MFAFAIHERDSGRSCWSATASASSRSTTAGRAAAALRLDAAGAARRGRRRHVDRPRCAAPLHELARGRAAAAHDPQGVRKLPPATIRTYRARRRAPTRATGTRLRAPQEDATSAARRSGGSFSSSRCARGEAAHGRRRAGRRAALRRRRFEPDRRAARGAWPDRPVDLLDRLRGRRTARRATSSSIRT